MNTNAALQPTGKPITVKTTNKPAVDKIIKGNSDYAISVCVTVLVLFGCVMIFSASYYTASTARFGEDPLFFLRSQALAAALGFGLMLMFSQINYKILKKPSAPFYMAAIFLLILVQIIGEEINGKKRWFSGVPVFGSVQPSEIAKIALIFFLAYIISRKENMLREKGGHLVCMLVTGVAAGLIMLGDLSTAIIVFLIGVCIVFIASPYILRFVFFAGIGASVVTAFVLFGDSFRAGRIQAWRDPESVASGLGYQVLQSLYAIGSGGFFGAGPGQSRQKMGFLLEVQNDIIFAVVVEELGWFGASFILILFGILIWRGIRVAMNATDVFGVLLASGITLLIAIQVVINIAVVTNTMPVTGVPLPFISHGGTSLVLMMAACGVLLNISKYRKAQHSETPRADA